MEIKRWNTQTVMTVARRAGVYGLLNGTKKVIYIGKSKDLQERLLGYINRNFSEDSCKRATEYFFVEYTEDYENREDELIRRYDPDCNDKL